MQQTNTNQTDINNAYMILRQLSTAKGTGTSLVSVLIPQNSNI